MDKSITMQKTALIVYLLCLPFMLLFGQSSFPELVEAAFGSDQELVNGIQFSNHYALVEGQPYFLDGSFRDGSVYISSQLYEHLKLRYNLFSQRVEIEYRNASGNRIQIMSVPELMPSFTLGSRTFVRMQIGDEAAMYYQLVSSGANACYIGWKKGKVISRNDSSRAYQFSAPIITYWLKLGEQWTSFHNRKTFIGIFPEQIQKEILKLLKGRRYSFKNATAQEAEEMIKSVLRLYEDHILP